MSNTENNEQTQKDPEKKISLEEAIRQKLANKKQNQPTGKMSSGPVKNLQTMQSQQTKKRNNQRKRTGV
jgi:hypothetical protein